MTLNELRYIVAVAEHRHFGRAARACCISQPTLSSQVKKLEQQLGVLLFERTNKSVRPTPVGDQVVDKARKVLDEVDDIHVACPAGHPLARAEAIALADLEREQILYLADGHCLRDQALAICGATANGQGAISGPPASRRCASWWQQASASRCCRRWRSASAGRTSRGSPCARSPAPPAAGSA